MCGIYTITNRINGKMIVGYTTNYYNRKYKHLSELRKGVHENNYLQNEFNKYGEDKFEFEILEECPENLLPALEHYWTLLLRTNEREFGYNLKATHPEYGRGRQSEEAKRKISEKNKGRKRPDNYIRCKGKKLPREQVEKATRNRLESLKVTPMKPRTQESREKMSRINKGQKPPQSSIDACSRPVICVKDADIRSYPSIRKASFDLGVTPSAVQNVIGKPEKRCKGFYINYKKVEL